MKNIMKILMPAVCALFVISCAGGVSSKKATTQNNETSETAQSQPQNAESNDDLAAACFDGDITTVMFYLNSGSSVNAVGEGGFTYLMYAAFNGHEDIVSLLLDRGAEVDAINDEGRSALMFAATSDSTPTVKLLLDKGAQVNMVDKQEHFSPLMFAATEGKLETVKLLLSVGANPNLKDIDDDTAMSFAAQGNHFDVVALLRGVTK